MVSVKEIESCLDYVAKTQNIKKYTYKLDGGALKTDGYMGDKTYLVMKGENPAGEEKTFNLFIKSASDDVNFRKSAPVQEVFEREIFIYSKLFKIFDDLQKEHNIKDTFSSVPKFYGYVIENNKEHLILENIKTEGFKLHDRKQAMDMDHIKLVLKSYAKLHALGFALKDQKSEIFREFSKDYSDLMGKLILQMNLVPNYVRILAKVKNILKENDEFSVLEKLENYDEKIAYILGTLCSEEKHDFVFLHGDCWTNNFMFKYENDSATKPVEVRILDWQLSKVGSPTIDISHYLYSCTSEEQLNSLDELLDVYYDTFCNFLQQLGSDPVKLFPKDRFLEHYKKYAKYGVFIMLLHLQVSFIDADESMDLLKAAESGDFSQALCGDIRDQHKLNARARDILVHAAERDLL